MKTYEDHFDEFLGYCRTLTDAQLENVLRAERRRAADNPGDKCFAACYAAARSETYRRAKD